MNEDTVQEKFWKGTFGNEYIKRNTLIMPKTLDKYYLDNLGISRSTMNESFLGKLNIHSILEVGSNIGNQLVMLQSQGYENLYGIEINELALQKAKELTKGISFIKGSVFDIPFKDNYFDVVFTAGVLIHIHPEDIKKAMKEIYRVSKKYIWGYEYFDKDYHQILYRGHRDRHWKGDFSKMYLKLFPQLKLVKETHYSRIENKNLIDAMFLLKKTS